MAGTIRKPPTVTSRIVELLFYVAVASTGSNEHIEVEGVVGMNRHLCISSGPSMITLAP